MWCANCVISEPCFASQPRLLNTLSSRSKRCFLRKLAIRGIMPLDCSLSGQCGLAPVWAMVLVQQFLHLAVQECKSVHAHDCEWVHVQCVCVHVHVCLCTWVCVHEYVHICKCVCMHVNVAWVWVHTSVCALMHVCMHAVSVRVSVHVHM